MRPQSPLVPPLRRKYLFQQVPWVDSTPLPAIVSPLVPYQLGPLAQHFKFQQRVLTSATGKELAASLIGVGLTTAAVNDLAAAVPLRQFRLRQLKYQQRPTPVANPTVTLGASVTGTGALSGGLAVTAAAKGGGRRAWYWIPEDTGRRWTQRVTEPDEMVVLAAALGLDLPTFVTLYVAAEEGALAA